MNKQTLPIDQTFHGAKPAPWASVKIVDDYYITFSREGRSKTYCLYDFTETNEQRLMDLLETPAFVAHEYTEWKESGLYGYEVKVVEYCRNCQPDYQPESEPRSCYISWMDNPKYYRCAGY